MGASEPVLMISPADVVLDPFPHVFKTPFVRPDLFARLKAEFPADELFDRNTALGGRAGRDIYPGDPLYDDLLANSPAWNEFASFIDSPAYIDLVVSLFGDHLQEFGCLADAKHIYYRQWIESREELARDATRVGRIALRVRDALGFGRDPQADPNELFVRMDIAQGAQGYAKPVHCDRPNRLTSMLIYFCNKADIGMEGGNLRVHRHREAKPIERYERHPKEESTEIFADIEPAENLGGMFLGCNNSYHSATAIHHTRGYRNFVYTSVASRSHRLWRS